MLEKTMTNTNCSQSGVKFSGLKRGVAVLSVMVLAGCALSTDYARPPVPVPATWSAATTVDSEAQYAAMNWRAFVVDARLRDFIALALRKNHDLQQTLLNVEAAQALYGVQRSERLPTLAASGEMVRQRVPADLSAAGRADVQSQYRVNLGMAQFELDLFGRVRNLSEAALQEFLAAEETARSAEIALIASVIQTWLVHNSALQRYQLAEQTLKARQLSLSLIEHRRRAGSATELDFLEAQGLVQQVAVELERIDREIRQSGNALVLLAGGEAARTQVPTAVQHDELLLQSLAPGLPSDLLINRPDIRAAERRLMASHARVDAARAAFFPRIALTGSFGTASSELSSLFGAGQDTWTFMPQISLPLFNGGRNRANLDLAEVRKWQEVQAYEQAIQQAFTEVQDALVATETLQREEDSQRRLLATRSEALRLSEARYQAGMDDHLRLLEARRSEFSARIGVVTVATERQLALLSLFRSLGGGWSDGTLPAPAMSEPLAQGGDHLAASAAKP